MTYFASAQGRHRLDLKLGSCKLFSMVNRHTKMGRDPVIVVSF